MTDTTTTSADPAVVTWQQLRTSCACGDVDLGADELGDELQLHDGRRHGQPACLLDVQPRLAELVDPADVLDKLLRELRAGRALVSLAVDDWQLRRQLDEALTLAHDVLDDARGVL